MAKPLAPRDMQRPNRRLGDVIRALVGCPICRLDPATNEVAQLQVVAYRTNTVRLRCPLCGLRFSVDHRQLVDALGRAGSLVNAMATTIYLRHEADP